MAISFAGENRDLARFIADSLETLDVPVFYDERFEANFLGKAWSAQFKEISSAKSRLVLCLLDKHHKDKIWPTFEREHFAPRVAEESVSLFTSTTRSLLEFRRISLVFLSTSILMTLTGVPKRLIRS